MSDDNKIDIFRRAMEWDDIFKREFQKESDRACVILSVAMLDRSLETLLKTSLVPTTSADDNLLDGAYTPISTFSARIDLAHRIGLISTRLCRDLHTIRKIRNAFAHNITGCTFNDASVRHQIIELIRSSQIDKKYPQVRKSFPSGCRGDFQITVSWILWYLSYLAEVTTPMKEAGLEASYWSKEEFDRTVKSEKE